MERQEGLTMELFGMGTMEIVLILVVALIVLGPGRVVGVGRTLGRIARTLRKASFDLTTAVTKEVEGQEKEEAPKSTDKNQ